MFKQRTVKKKSLQNLKKVLLYIEEITLKFQFVVTSICLQANNAGYNLHHYHHHNIAYYTVKLA